MSKLIYVDRLKKDILALPNCYNGFSDTYDKACIIGVIDEQPTIEERKTGKWIKEGLYVDRHGDMVEIMRCSLCGQKHYYTQGTTSLDDNMWFSFCPNCGARMEVEHD